MRASAGMRGMPSAAGRVAKASWTRFAADRPRGIAGGDRHRFIIMSRNDRALRDGRTVLASPRAALPVISNTLCAGTGRALAAASGGSGDCRGHGACRGSGTPRPDRLVRSSANVIDFPSRQSRSDSAGAGSVPASAKTKLGIFGQCEIATFSDGGCNCHSCGSVGVAGFCGVAGTTWTMRYPRAFSSRSIRGKAATVRAWMSCSSRMPLPLSSSRFIARS